VVQTPADKVLERAGREMYKERRIFVEKNGKGKASDALNQLAKFIFVGAQNQEAKC